MKHRKNIFTVSLIAMFALLSTSPVRAGYCPGQGDFSSGQAPYIGGVLTDIDTGLPTAGVKVVLSCCSDGTDYNEAVTGIDGRYSFGGETGTRGFWISACYNVRIEATCLAVTERIDQTTPNCPKVGQGGCFRFKNCDNTETFRVDFKVRNLCTQGCSLGYWRHHPGRWPSDYSPADDFDTTFGVDLFKDNITLLQALWRRGGTENKLARQGVAAILNAGHADVSYPLSVDDVIGLVQAGDADSLEVNNELDCPLRKPHKRYRHHGHERRHYEHHD